MWIGRGTNLFQALGKVPPSVATAPSSAEIRNRVRDTCQPPRFPAAAERHEWQEKPRPGAGDDLGHLGEHRRVDARLGGGELERELGVELGQDGLERLEGARAARGGTAPGTPPSSTSGGRTRGRTGPSRIRWLAMARLMAASLPGCGDSQ